MTTKTKILITGCNGFVGKALVKLLKAEQDYYIVGIDRENTEDTSCIDHFIQKDLNEVEPQLIHELTGDLDYAIHLAASRTDWGIEISKFHVDNVVASEAFCRLIDTLNINSVLHVSSVAVYEFSSSTKNYLGCDEESIDYTTDNSYGLSKYISERIIKSHCESKNIPLNILRPSAIFGPDQPADTNTHKLFSICKKNWLPIPASNARKSVTYIENFNHFIADRILANENDTYLTIESPVLTVNQFVRHILEAGNSNNLILPIPKWSLIVAGYLFDGLSIVLRRDLKISSVRVKKFYKETSFDSEQQQNDGYTRKYSLKQAIERTVMHE